MTANLCYCIEDDCPKQHGSLPAEFSAGRCVDCGMSVPDGEIICDQCKAAWQLYSYTAGGDVRRQGDTTVQSGVQEFPRQDQLWALPDQTSDDAPLRTGEEG